STLALTLTGRWTAAARAATLSCTTGSATPTPASTASSAAADATRHHIGHVNQARAYHGRSAQWRTAASPRGSRVSGARSAGSDFSSRSIRPCSSTGCIVVLQLLPERFATAVDVGLDLAQGDAERVGDALVAHVLHMKEHERDALMVGQTLQGGLEADALVLLFGVERGRIRCGERGLEGLVGFRVA